MGIGIPDPPREKCNDRNRNYTASISIGLAEDGFDSDGSIEVIRTIRPSLANRRPNFQLPPLDIAAITRSTAVDTEDNLGVVERELTVSDFIAINPTAAMMAEGQHSRLHEESSSNGVTSTTGVGTDDLAQNTRDTRATAGPHDKEDTWVRQSPREKNTQERTASGERIIRPRDNHQGCP